MPRRQRNTRRRLSFSRNSSPARRVPEAAVIRPRSMERRTSGIYDLIDAIGLLGAPNLAPCMLELATLYMPSGSTTACKGSGQPHMSGGANSAPAC